MVLSFSFNYPFLLYTKLTWMSRLYYIEALWKQQAPLLTPVQSAVPFSSNGPKLKAQRESMTKAACYFLVSPFPLISERCARKSQKTPERAQPIF